MYKLLLHRFLHLLEEEKKLSMGFPIVYLNVFRGFFPNMVHNPAHEFFIIFPAHEFKSKNKQVPFFKRGAHPAHTTHTNSLEF